MKGRNLGIAFGSFCFLIVIISVFYFGITRLSRGINYLRIIDSSLAHYSSVGLLYIQLSTIALVGFAILITYSLTRTYSSKFVK